MVSLPERPWKQLTLTLYLFCSFSNVQHCKRFHKKRLHSSFVSNHGVIDAMSSRLSLCENKEITTEQRKYVIAAKNKLGKSDDDWSEIAEGYQILDVELIAYDHEVDAGSRFQGKAARVLFHSSRFYRFNRGNAKEPAHWSGEEWEGI